VKAVSNKNLSTSTLSRFENGCNAISVERFFEALRAINTSPEEFIGFFNHLNNKESFFEDSDYSWNLKTDEDQRLINRLEKDYKRKYLKDPSRTNYLKYLVFKGTIRGTKHHRHFREKESEFVFNYLKTVADWGRFELFVLERCAQLISLKYVRLIVSMLPSKTVYFRKIFPNEWALDKVYISLINCFISFEDAIGARKLIDEAESLISSDNHMTSKFYFKWDRLVVDYRMGNRRVLAEMKKMIYFLETINCGRLLDIFTHDYEKYAQKIKDR
jgi:Rgg/GadR/MutR family transcriptional activator